MTDATLLRDRHFLILLSGNGLSLAGSAAVRIAYPTLALTASGSPAAAGWVTLAVSIPAVLFQIPAGIAADRLNRRTTMLAGQTLGLAATASAGLAVALRLPHLTLILVLAAFLEGTAFSFFALAEFTAVRDVVAADQRPAAFSFFEAEQPVANLLGRTLGGGLLAAGRAAPFLANAATYLFCLLTLVTVPGHRFAPKPAAPRPWRTHFAEGFHWAWTVPFIRCSAITTGLTNALFQGVVLLFIVTMTENHRSTWGLGAVLASAGVGGLAGAFTAARTVRRFRGEAVYRACLWAWTAMILLIASTANPYVYAAAWAGIGGIGAVSSVAMTVVRLRSVPEAALGRMMGSVAAVTAGAAPLGSLLIGFLLAAYGTGATAWVIFTVMLLTAVAGTYATRDPRPEPDPADERSAAR